jgi:hypothetical protein
MSNRRSRSADGRRARKARASEAPPQQDVAVLAPQAGPVSELVRIGAPTDPTETAQLRALEAGWDELLA